LQTSAPIPKYKIGINGRTNNSIQKKIEFNGFKKSQNVNPPPKKKKN
jgi:hypothetical protein